MTSVTGWTLFCNESITGCGPQPVMVMPDARKMSKITGVTG